MQNLIFYVASLAIVAFFGYKIVYYLPYVFTHIAEIMAYISVGLVLLGTGWFVVNFGNAEEKK